MRALLIVNPRATSTTGRRRDAITHALAAALDLAVVQTRYRGHARHVAAEAAKTGCDVVITLGGDGTVNEAVNGLMAAAPEDGGVTVGRPEAGPVVRDPAAHDPVAHDPVARGPVAGGPVLAPLPGGPVLAPLPGGSANVFARAIGLAADPVDATGEVLAALGGGSTRAVGLGLAGDRYFCINAGLGLDAEVVQVIEGWRSWGRPATAALYLRATARQFLFVTDRRDPALTVELPGRPAVAGLFFGIVSNTSPWTYLGRRPVIPSPRASFDTGLDLFALRNLGTVSTLAALRQMLYGNGAAPRGRHIASLHDEPAFALRASRPVAFQLDGEYVGERECVTFRAVPRALRVVNPRPAAGAS